MANTPKVKPPVLFAFPIANEEILAHFPNGQVPNPVPPDIYQPYAGKISVDRPFRQPVVSAHDELNFSSGLELFMKDDELASRVYAWFTGILRWVPAVTTTGDADSGGRPMRASLRLVPDVNLIAGLKLNPKSIQSPPSVTIYENLDQADVEATMKTLVRKAYDDSQTLAEADWHPLLKGRDSNNKTTIRDAIRKAATVQAGVDAIVAKFTSAANNSIALTVQAGDLIAHAATTGAPDPNKARQVVFHALDVSRQFLNPTFYLHLYSKATAGIAIVTIVSDDHPLLVLFPELKGATRPPARIKATDGAGNPQLHIPVGHLSEDHTVTPSKIKWRYEPITSPPGASPEDVTFFTTPAQSLIAVTPPGATDLPAFWQQYGTDLSAFCDALHVPCEIAMAIMGHETSWDLRPNARKKYRLEPLSVSQRTQVRAIHLELQYDYTIGILSDQNTPVTVTLNPAAAGFNTDVTSVLGVQLERARTLGTANQLVSKEHKLVVVADVFRPEVTASSVAGAGGNPANFYDITIMDERFPGKVTVSPGATMFVGLSGASSANRATVEKAPNRAGTLRVLRARLTDQTKTSPYPVTLTVLLDGQAGQAPITFTLKAGDKAGSEFATTLSVTTAQKVSVQVTAAGSAGQGNVALDVELYSAPAAGALVLLADGTNTGATGLNDIPEPWAGNADVKTIRTGTRSDARSLKWDELGQVLEEVKGDCMSPGYMQTKIATAFEAINYVKTREPGLFASFNLPAVPALFVDYIKAGTNPGWLLVPRQAFFAGIARMREGLNSERPGYDLPIMCSDYNAGTKVKHSHVARRYGVLTNSDGTLNPPRPGYIDDAAARLNLVVDHFANHLAAGDPIPSVRLKR